MLTKMNHEQVSIFWPFVKHAILNSQSIPKSNQDGFANDILQGILAGNTQCWLEYNREEEEVKPYGILITTILKDIIYNVPFLYLATAYAFRKLSDEELQEDFKVIKQFAVDTNCEYIKSNTGNERIKQVFSLIGMIPTETIYRMDL